jgi:hypothetical protein
MASTLQMHRDFLSAYSALSRADQGRIRSTLDSLVADPSAKGLRLHKVGPWLSISASMSLRVLAHRLGDVVTLVHVDTHDEAYRWGNRHSPVAGDRGLLGIIAGSVRGEQEPGQPQYAVDSELASRLQARGLPSGLAQAIASTDDDQLLDVIGSLAPELQEAALAAAVGDDVETVRVPSDISVIDGDEALHRALALPDAAWRVFLHPRQRFVVDAPSDHHLFVRGGPGTGKTIALVHRFARLTAEASRTAKRPPCLLTLDASMRKVLLDALADLGITIEPDNVMAADDLKGQLGRALGRFSGVLIDEGQDLPIRLIAELVERLEVDAGSIPPMTVAFDPNQAVSSPSGDALARLLAHAESVVTLSYCYRATAELVRAASELLERLHTEVRGKDFQHQHHIDASRDRSTARFVTALSGPEPSRVPANESQVAQVVAREAERLSAQSAGSVAVVVSAPQEVMTSIRAAITDPAIECLTPREAKGREWRAGIVVDALGAAPHPDVVTAARYRSLCGLYVGLTRFRDRATLIPTYEESPLAR